MLTDAEFSALLAKTDQPWYVVLSKPRQERLAEQSLLRQSYSVYLPWLKKYRLRAKK